MSHKPYLLNLSPVGLKELMAAWGEPAYRAGQIETWLYQRHAGDVAHMSSLPKSLRQRLAEETELNPLKPLVVLDSSDGFTRKSLFSLPDGREVEAVLMRYEQRQTLCISTQAGCAMACPFCATGQMGFMRNLTAGEIVAQVLYYAQQLDQEGTRVSNITPKPGRPSAGSMIRPASTWGHGT
jgi:23S rRNA (adenine2503-C2)-methyltransferase